MKQSKNTWNTMTAATIAAMLTMGGAALAGEVDIIEQNDGYGGNFTAQTTTLILESHVDQSDPYGSGAWTAQDTTALGGRPVVVVDGNRTAGNPRVRSLRENTRQRRLCNRPVIRLILQRAYNIELNCP